MQRPSPITGAWWAAKIVALSFLLVIKIVAFFGYNWIIKLWQRDEQGIVTAKEWQSTAKSMANTGIKRKEFLSSLYTEQAFCYNQKVLAEHPSFWGWQRPSSFRKDIFYCHFTLDRLLPFNQIIKPFSKAFLHKTLQFTNRFFKLALNSSLVTRNVNNTLAPYMFRNVRPWLVLN